MNTFDPDRDADRTTDWPSNRPAPPPTDDDGGATTVVPRYTPNVPPPARPAPPQYGYGQPAGPGWPPQAAPPAAAGGWQPPGHYPVTGYPAGAPTPPPGKKRPWGLIAAALIAVVVLAGAGVFALGGIKFGSDDEKSDPTSSAASGGDEESEGATEGSPKTSSEPTSDAPAAGADGTVDPAALPNLLASVPALNEKYKADLTPTGPVQSEPFSGVLVMPSNCAGALLPGIDYVYKTANYTGFAGQILTDDATSTKVIQSVITFNSETEATRFFNDQYTSWRACHYTEITISAPGQRDMMKAGVSSESDGVASIMIWPGDKPAGSAGNCDRGMSPRKNVIIDVRICTPKGGMTLASSLAKDIGKKISGKR